MEYGYIKLNRSMLSWRYFQDPKHVLLWLYILLNANHQDKEYQNVFVKRGQLMTSLEKLSKDTGISKQSVRTVLSHLEGEEITCESTKRYTLITVLKYDDYQGKQEGTNTNTNKRPTHDQHTTNTQLTQALYNKNVKNIKNDKNIYEQIPSYDGSFNKVLSKEEEKEILKYLGKA